jgi:hypothetical protein
MHFISVLWRRCFLAHVSLTHSPAYDAAIPEQRSSILWSLAAGTTPRAVTTLGWILYAALIILLAGQVFLPVVPQDEGELLAYSWLMTRGLVLYRDIWSMYPPATYLALAGLIKVGIPGLIAERGLSLGVHALYPLLINRACTRSWTRFSWLGVLPAFTFTLLVAIPDIRAYPWLTGEALLVAGLLISRRHPRWGALVFLLATATRLELVVPAIVFMSLMSVLQDKGRRQWIQGLVIVVLGTALLLAGLSLMTSGAAFGQLIVDAFIRIPPGRSLPFHPLAILLPILPLEFVTLAGPILCCVVGLLKQRPYILASNASVATLLPHFFQRAEVGYLFAVSDVVVPWLVFSLIALRDVGGPPGASPRARSRPRLGTVALALIAASSSVLAVFLLGFYLLLVSPLSPRAPLSVSGFHSRQVTSGVNVTVATSAKVARDDRQVLTYLHQHGRPSQRIYVSPINLRHSMWNMTAMYFILPMRPATPYLEMNPGIESRAPVQRQIIRDLRNATWVLLWKGGFWYEDNASQELGSPLLARYIRAHFRPVLRNRTYVLMRQHH